MSPNRVPSILLIGGHDPSGAGIQADIETCAALGCHAASIVTALTAQNTREVIRVTPVDADLLTEQARHLLDDFAFAACKTGLIADAAVLAAVCDVLRGGAMAVVVDPVLAAGSGASFAGDRLARAVLSELLPLARVCTPNMAEARRLTGRDTTDAMGAALNDAGTEYALLTGADEPSEAVSNVLYYRGERIREFTWPRLPGRYHGSGCTLAAAIACLLGSGLDEITAIEQAQAFTWACLHNAYDFGAAQRIPNRQHMRIPGDSD